MVSYLAICSYVVLFADTQIDPQTALIHVLVAVGVTRQNWYRDFFKFVINCITNQIDNHDRLFYEAT